LRHVIQNIEISILNPWLPLMQKQRIARHTNGSAKLTENAQFLLDLGSHFGCFPRLHVGRESSITFDLASGSSGKS